MKFSPSGDGILVEDGDTQETTQSGLALPDSAVNPYIYGTILKLGKGRRNESGDLVEHDYWVGQKVMYHRHGGRPMEIEGEDVRLIVPADIVGTETEDE